MSYDEVETWWQSTTPETQSAIQQGSVAVVALLCGCILGAMATRVLAGVKFDASLRLPSASPATEEDRGVAPSVVAGFLVCFTVWALAAWWVAHQQGLAEFAATLGVIIKRTWGFAALLFAFLTLGNLLAHRLTSCLHPESSAGPATTRFQSSENAKPVEVSHRGLAGAVGAGAYVVVLLLVLLVAADSFDWPLSRSAVSALWQFTEHLLLAVSALFIGCLGARWARDMITAESSKSPEKRVGEYTAAALVAATTGLAVGVLLFGAKVLVIGAAVATIGLLAWSARTYLRDVTAGWHLRAYKVAEVRLEGEQPWQIVETGLLTSELGRAGEFCRLPNRKVLEICLHGKQA
jgi:hypothetical protein